MCMLFFDFIERISTTSSAVRYLREKGALASSQLCEKCDMSMPEQVYELALDGTVFRCSKCKARKSIRAGSFFREFKLELKIITSLLYLMLLEVPHKKIAEVLGLSKNVVTDFGNLMREEYSKKLCGMDEKLGGPGVVVQVCN